MPGRHHATAVLALVVAAAGLPPAHADGGGNSSSFGGRGGTDSVQGPGGNGGDPLQAGFGPGGGGAGTVGGNGGTGLGGVGNAAGGQGGQTPGAAGQDGAPGLPPDDVNNILGSSGGGGGGGAHGFVGAAPPATAATGGAGGAGGVGGSRNLDGGGGGAGGYGAVLTGTGALGTLDVAVTGGRGGNGGLPGLNGGEGGGGSGGIGLWLNAGASVTVNAAVTGGAGGDVVGLSLSSPGRGGVGAVISAGSTLTNNATITGGTGGNSPQSSASAGGTGATVAASGTLINNGAIRGGDGGVGVFGGNAGHGATIAAGGTLINSGTLRGGNGGGDSNDSFGGGNAGHGVTITAGGTLINSGAISGGDGGAGAFAGNAGDGVTGQNLTIINSGTIQGGVGGSAIRFTAGSNRLELQAGSNIIGRVRANAGSTLTLGGTADATFDVSRIGTQYTGFSVFEKTGASIWELTGTTTATTAWRLRQGELSVSSDSNLGAPAGALNFDGGTLRIAGTGFTSTARTINWGANGGGFNIVDAAATFTLGQSLTGGGGLAKSGAGTLVLAGVNTYTGATTVSAGTLRIGPGGSIASSSTVTLSAAGATLDIAADAGDQGVQNLAGVAGSTVVLGRNLTVASTTDTTFAGMIAGSSGLDKTGSGTLTLAGANTYTGTTSITAGTLALGAGGSIAHSSLVSVRAGGTLDIAHGGDQTLQTLAGVAGATVALGANTLTTGAAADAAFAGTIIGSGGVIKSGTGTWTLLGTNSYTGDTAVDAGTLQIGTGGSIASSSAVTLRAAGATLDIAPGGHQTVQNLGGVAGSTVSLGTNTLTVASSTDTIFAGAIGGDGGVIKSGAGTLTLTGANTYSGGTIINAGTLQLGDGGAIAGTIANSGTLAFNRSDTVTFGNIVSGTGGLRQVGSGTTILTGASPYRGPTTVENGRLVVNGAIARSIITVTGGTLAGTGTVGGVIAGSGGTVAPGNSIGTLTVAGNISFAPGSTYEVEIEPSGTSDRLHATGTATLSGGTVPVIKAIGSYTGGRRYTILTADAGVTGTFANLVETLPFIDLALTYDPNTVSLLVTRNAVTFCSLAGSANQCAVANSAETLGAGTPLYDIIASLPDTAAARQAFNALSGEIHASTRSALIEDSHYLRDAVVTRTRLSGIAISAAPQFAALAQATDQRQRPQDGTAVTAWFQGFGAIARTSSDGNAATAKRTTGGFFIGADTRIGDTWTIGLATGYSRSTVDVDGRSSRATIDSYHLALYGGAQFGPIGVRLGASHTWHSIDSSRSITFPGLADAARADYKARTTQLFGDVGYTLALGDVALEPFANLAWVHLSTNRFGERGGIAALRTRGGSDSNLFSTLGIRAAAQVWNDDNKTLTLRGTLGWRHAFGDVTPAARLAFAGGTSFGVEGVPIARNAVVVEAGFDLKVGKSFTVGAGYSGVLASGARDHAFKGNLTYRF